MKTIKSIALYLSVAGYVYVGFLHFIQPDFFLQIMPPYLPFHLPLVYVSGLIEIILGLCLLIKKLRFYVGWGLIILLLAVYPANIYLAQTNGAAMNTTPLIAWGRLPIQFIFIGLAYWHSLDK